MSQQTSALSFGVKFAFGFGQIAEGIKTCVFGTFLLLYYNQVLGLSGDLAGLAIFIALIFDAVTDPIAGSVSDRWRSSQGRRHPFMYASAVPLAICFSALFIPLVSVAEHGQTGLFLWMLIATVATRASLTLYHVPHMALGAELSDDFDERTVLVAMRHFFGAVGFLLAYIFGFGLFFQATDAFPNGQLNPAAYPPFALTMSVIMLISILWTAWGTRSRIPYMPQPKDDEAKVRIRDVFLETYEAMQNVSFRWMMIGFILIIAAWGMADVLGIYVYTFFWELSGPQMLIVLIFGPIGSILSYPFSKWFYAWLERKTAMIVAGVMWMIVHALPISLYLMGLVPDKSTWALVLFLSIYHVGIGISVGQLVVGLGSGMADIADENEARTGRRQEGVFFGASAFANKCSAGLGTMFAGFVLEAIAWPTGSAVRTAADVSADTVFQLAFIAGPAISLIAIPGVLCFKGYALTRARLENIQADLRSGETASS